MALRKNIPIMLQLEGKLVQVENAFDSELDTWVDIINALSIMKTLSADGGTDALVIPSSLKTELTTWLETEKNRLASELALL